ncbi:MAG: methyltransferase domain-containing protein [Halioglobus sp.]|nr:methyltransferase domain-containing protein [Halioglobus sp.]
MGDQWVIETGEGTASLWRCIQCFGSLQQQSEDSITCAECGANYPAVDGIPDLRARDGISTYADDDLADARRLSAACRGASLESVMDKLCDRPEHDDATRAFRVRQILDSPQRLRVQIEGWLAPCLSKKELFLDVGCGSGGLLAEASAMGFLAAGIDASMTMLVAAKHMVEAHGGVARLACAWAEALPVADDSLGAVTLYDSIEHVGDVGATIAQARRVLKPGASMAISTPNRFSLAAEPHVFLWGVGWLPRRWQQPYVRWRNGQDYSGTKLLSTWEIARELRRHVGLQYQLRVPQVPSEEIAHFTPRRAFLARLYNRIAQFRFIRIALLAVGPFFQVIARRVAIR